MYQGLVVAGFCFAMQTHLLTTYSATQISTFAFLTPLFGVAGAVALRGDRLSPWLYASAAGIALGIWFVNRRPEGSENPLLAELGAGQSETEASGDAARETGTDAE